MNADPVLTLMHQSTAASPRRLDVPRGSSVTLGSCSCADCGADLVVAARPGAWVRCAVTAHDDHWRLDNVCADVDAVVVDQENPALQVIAPPGRRRLVVPFEFSEVTFRLGPCLVSESVTVIGPEVLVESGAACRTSLAPLSGAELRPGTNYSAVLEELCRGVGERGVPPTSAVVSKLLARRGLRVSPKAVDHHIDYLFHRVFPTESVTEGRSYKRWALASLVLRSAPYSTRVGTAQ